MKLATLERNGKICIGAVLAEHSVLDLQAAAVLFHPKRGEDERSPGGGDRLIPGDMGVFLGKGKEALDLAGRRLSLLWIRTASEPG